MSDKKVVKKVGINDFDEDGKEEIQDTVSANAKLLGADEWEGPRQFKPDDQWGICATCQSFQYCRTEFDKMFAKCSETNMMLNQKDRMTECTMYAKIGQMDLRDMQQIAWYINPSKRKVGF